MTATYLPVSTYIGKAEVLVRKNIEYVQWRNVSNLLELTPEQIKIWLQGYSSVVAPDELLIIKRTYQNKPQTLKIPLHCVIVKEDTYEENVLIMDVNNFNWYKEGYSYKQVYIP